MAKRYRYSFVKTKEAEKGKLSVGLAAASILFLAAVLTAFALDGAYGFIVGGICLFATMLSVYGFILGLLSFSEEKRMHRTSVVGSILNGIIMVGWLGFFNGSVKNGTFRETDAVYYRSGQSKNIFRQTYLADGNRKENDAEHSWHLALMAVLLKEYSNEEVSLEKVIPMVLIHDLVEIDAGDTYAYDEAGAATKEIRERKAAERIFGLLPEDQKSRFRQLWEEFEAYETPEAKFAHVLDNCQPLLLNDASGGRSWAEHGVKKPDLQKKSAYFRRFRGNLGVYEETGRQAYPSGKCD